MQSLSSRRNRCQDQREAMAWTRIAQAEKRYWGNDA
jgi:hypothetical protein